MKISKTYRGFDLIEFIDLYGMQCSIQKSSLATEGAIWLGVDNPEPMILAHKIIEDGRGWAKYPIPKDVEICARMHLNREQVKKLISVLQIFVATGEIV